MTTLIQKIIGRRKKAKQVLAAHRVILAVGAGTTGKKSTVEIEAAVPTLRGSTLAIDGEISREEEMRSENLIVIPDAPIDDALAKVERSRLLAADPLIRATAFPHDTERGAGTCRLAGMLKGAFVLEALERKASRILRRRLARIQNQEQRLVVEVHLISAAGGGLGSALLTLLALILRDLVRRESPGARCYIVVHLITAAHLEDRIADQDIRTKVQANDFATFLELNWAQDPRHVARLYELLGCEPLSNPTFDRVIPYAVGDERDVAMTLEQVITDRLIPNILAGENAGVANRLRELASNTAARDAGGRRTVAHPMVSVCQAASASVPQHLGSCWSLRETLKGLMETLAKPSTERLKTFEAPAKTMLGVENLKSEVGRVCGEPLAEILTTAKSVRRKPSAQAHASLTEAYGRYHSAVRPGMEAKCRTLIQHHGDVVFPETLGNVIGALIDRGATLSEVIVTLRHLGATLVDLGDRINKEAEKAAAGVKAKRDEFNAHMQKLSADPMLAGKVKERAATALNDMINADNGVLRHRTLLVLVRQLGQALADATYELAEVHREAVKVRSSLKRRYRELRGLATRQTTTFRSVIVPEKFDDAMRRIDAGIRGSGEATPDFDVKGLIAEGHLGVIDRIEAHVQELASVFEGYFDANLTDVGGTVKALQLGFSLQEWIDSTVRNLACCSPVRTSVAANVEPQTLIVASGDDLEAVKQALGRRPTLAHVEVIPGSDPRSVMIHRRIDGLTVEAIPSFADSRRAARAFPKPGPGLTAWEMVGSSGHLLGAFEQEGLVPEEWARRPVTRVVETAASNGEAVGEAEAAHVGGRFDD
jgi:hypothetical protein